MSVHLSDDSSSQNSFSIIDTDSSDLVQVEQLSPSEERYVEHCIQTNQPVYLVRDGVTKCIPIVCAEDVFQKGKESTSGVAGNGDAFQFVSSQQNEDSPFLGEGTSGTSSWSVHGTDGSAEEGNTRFHRSVTPTVSHSGLHDGSSSRASSPASSNVGIRGNNRKRRIDQYFSGSEGSVAGGTDCYEESFEAISFQKFKDLFCSEFSRMDHNRRYMLHDIYRNTLSGRFREDDRGIIPKSTGNSSASWAFVVFEHGKHIHVIHLCRYERSWCSCALTKKAEKRFGRRVGRYSLRSSRVSKSHLSNLADYIQKGKRRLLQAFLARRERRILGEAGLLQNKEPKKKNILLAMLNDALQDVKQLAVQKIMNARRTKSSTVRKFKVPLLNFNAETYSEMIFWNEVTVTQPPILQYFSEEDLENLAREKDLQNYSFYKYPCHTQSVERCVKIVTEASALVCGGEERDGLIRSKLKARLLMPAFEPKSQFKFVK
ncbi:unnamed protein product [Bemisia tabaci]|uniref:Uncharacterized protein n=1 Tax=Bemisia tabaci TaxID=7038 RepID=A0A9P0A3J2_BEMTA|nr:unnamed protein product [Bemisia tabaci]